MKKLFINLLLLSIGCLSYAIGLGVFLQPNSIAPGGFSGIAIILNFMFGLPTGAMLFAMNIPAFLVAYRKLGRYFVLTTIYAVMLSSFFIDFIPQYFTVKSDPILSSIYGGLFLGFGLGINFRVGSSTGSTDIITRIIRLYKPHMSLGQLMILIDVLVVISGVIALGDIDMGLYAIIVLYITSKVIDTVIEGPDLAKLIYIISDKNEEIGQEIGQKLTRGSTLLNGEGVYTKTERKVLMCAVRRHQIPIIKEIALSYDERAFMIVTDVHEVLGYGFKLKGERKYEI